MTYDVARDCVVVHAGYDRTQTDTWEYRQGQWSSVNAGPTTYHWRRDLVFDWRAWRVRMIGFDSSSTYTPIQPGETWLYDGTAWVQSALPPHPAPRRGHVMVYDPVRGATVLFGGQWPWRNDTWEYAGGQWSSINTTTSPSPRSFAAAASEASTGSILMFGGSYANGQLLFDQTWRLNGLNWNQVATSVRPPPRCNHAMALDASRGRIVMFGGASSLSTFPPSVHADTWEFDGQRWNAVTPPSSPPGRYNHAMAYDTARSRIVVFGGNDSNAYPFVDTWQYDGATWSQLPASGGPDLWRDVGGLRMTYDPQRGKLLLLGTRLWELDGLVWRAVATPSGPSIPVDAGWVATPHDGVLLFGGVKYGSNFEEADQWSFHAAETPSWTRFGAGCGSGTSAPTLDVMMPQGSVLGTTVNVQVAAAGADLAMVAGGLDVWQWNGVALPIPLDDMPVPGCKLWIAATIDARFVALQGGLGTLPIALPADPTLAGIALCLQAMTGDTTVGESSLALTNAGVLRVY
jgi:hypothetical protein